MVKKLLCVVILSAATACLPPVTDVAPGSPFQADTLTVDGTDRYALYGDHHNTAVVARPDNQSSNTRVAVTTAWQAPTVDHSVCATWTSAAGPVQPGLMLRWDGTRGISVTRNSYASVYTVVNVHQWDLTKPDGAGRFEGLAGFPLSGLGWPGAAVPLPWRACAWATGSTVSFHVWPLPDPPSGGACCGGTVTVTHLGAGRPGWYAGHLPPGGVLTLTDLTTS